MSDESLRLLALYPEQMNIYADRGNILFLQCASEQLIQKARTSCVTDVWKWANVA